MFPEKLTYPEHTLAPLANGWRYVVDPREVDNIPSPEFTAYFANQTVPLANPANTQSFHDEQHKPQYERMFQSEQFASVTQAAAQASKDDPELCKTFTRAIDCLGDALLFFGLNMPEYIFEIRDHLESLVSLVPDGHPALQTPEGEDKHKLAGKLMSKLLLGNHRDWSKNLNVKRTTETESLSHATNFDEPYFYTQSEALR